MSFLYNYRKKRPQVWTYPVFILIAVSVFWAFFAYGQKKAAERAKEQVNAEPERTF